MMLRASSGATVAPVVGERTATRSRLIGWIFASDVASPAEHVADSELLTALQAARAEDLSVHQREVLVAITLNGVPIDVIAERLNTARGALYETLLDARKKLRRRLAAGGFDIAERGGDPVCATIAT